MKNQLQEMANHLAEAQNMLLKLEERHDAQELEISRVTMLNDKLNAQLKEHETTIEDLKKLLKHQSQAHVVSLNEVCSQNYCINVSFPRFPNKIYKLTIFIILTGKFENRRTFC